MNDHARQPASASGPSPASVNLDRVQRLLNERFPMLRGLPLDADTALISSGLLDSFAVVTLVAALETAFSLDIQVDEVELEAFETPRAITELCLRTQTQTLNGR